MQILQEQISARPNRYQLRPCHSDYLPPGRGDACVTQAGFASHAGQTKKAAILGIAAFFVVIFIQIYPEGELCALMVSRVKTRGVDLIQPLLIFFVKLD